LPVLAWLGDALEGHLRESIWAKGEWTYDLLQAVPPWERR
jgi:hypothetical protein